MRSESSFDRDGDIGRRLDRDLERALATASELARMMMMSRSVPSTSLSTDPRHFILVRMLRVLLVLSMLPLAPRRAEA
jgi:hypothetical protein